MNSRQPPLRSLDSTFCSEQVGPRNILECSIRDGNYAVDFKFTKSDTRRIVSCLAHLGFQWIEIGHGLGLGGTEAGKGKMLTGDCELITAAKEQAGTAKVGCFFIPGIGNFDRLREAREAGLDFVRIGCNAVDIDHAYPYLEYARRLGLLTCLNMMKSYTLKPEQFAEKVKEAEKAGAELVYCVDSAGCMLPEEVRPFFLQAREKSSVMLGFHGHNNLMCAVANCLTAFEAGAQFVDCTIYGLGRSAGNAPTEILVAILDRLGIPTGIDLFSLMDFAEAFFGPIVSTMNMYSMQAVAEGFSRFHSSFLPKVMEAARNHNVDTRRLLARMGQINPSVLDASQLEQEAKHLVLSGRFSTTKNFAPPKDLRPGWFGTTFQAFAKLLDEMEVYCAKNVRARSLLHVLPSDVETPDEPLSELVYCDSDVIVGRIQYSNFNSLNDILNQAQERVFRFLIEEGEGWSSEALQFSFLNGPCSKVLSFNLEKRKTAYLRDVLSMAGQRFGWNGIVVYGWNDQIPMEAFSELGFLHALFVGKSLDHAILDRGLVSISTLQDWKNLDLSFSVVCLMGHMTEEDESILARVIPTTGAFLALFPEIDCSCLASKGFKTGFLNMNNLYAGFLNSLFSIPPIIWGHENVD